LTAAGFADWRGWSKERSDNVERSGDYYTIRTASTNAFIAQASMVVRASDFHPFEQHLRFADNRQLDLREIKFEMEKQQLAAPVQTAQVESVKLHQIVRATRRLVTCRSCDRVWRHS
jgi:hypothetical protein